MSEMPKYLQNYFDSKRFIDDCKHDGRGHWLSGYDGHENYQTVDVGGEVFEFYIYKN